MQQDSVSVGGSTAELTVYNSSKLHSASVAQSRSRNVGSFCFFFSSVVCICTIEKGLLEEMGGGV